MSTAGRADRDDVDVRIGEHFFQVVISLAADLVSEPVGRRGECVVAGNDLRAADLFNGLCMKPRNHAAADDGETSFRQVFLLSLSEEPRNTQNTRRGLLRNFVFSCLSCFSWL